MHTEDLHFAEPPMSIAGMLIPSAVVGELDIGLFVVLVAMAIATEIVITSIANMMGLYVRSPEGSGQRLSVGSGALM